MASLYYSLNLLLKNRNQKELRLFFVRDAMASSSVCFFLRIYSQVAQHLARTYGDRAYNVGRRCKITGRRWPVVGKRLHEDYPYLEVCGVLFLMCIRDVGQNLCHLQHRRKSILPSLESSPWRPSMWLLAGCVWPSSTPRWIPDFDPIKMHFYLQLIFVTFFHCSNVRWFNFEQGAIQKWRQIFYFYSRGYTFKLKDWSEKFFKIIFSFSFFRPPLSAYRKLWIWWRKNCSGPRRKRRYNMLVLTWTVSF